jgi:G3E family GTPase
MKSVAAKPRLIVVGGFFGAGKTTAVSRLAGMLKENGNRVGVITNDEGTELVDSAQLRALGLDVEEVSGGPFAEQLSAFFQSAERLKDRDVSIIFAEACGSSAGLRATLIEPLVSKDGPGVYIAPLSVIVDAVRAARFLRLDSGTTFSEKLSYVFRKQIEEAEIIVLSKCDLLPTNLISGLRKAFGEIAPDATIFSTSLRGGSGFDEWLNCLMTKEHTPARPASIDSEIFANAEALLGWLNCTIKVSSVKYFDAEKLLSDLATTIQSILRQDGIEIAHLKTVLRATNDSTGALDSVAINLVRNDATPELTGKSSDPVQRAELILNLRAEGKPERLHAAVNRAVLEIMERGPELFARMEHCEHFSRGGRS